MHDDPLMLLANVAAFMEPMPETPETPLLAPLATEAQLAPLATGGASVLPPPLPNMFGLNLEPCVLEPGTVLPPPQPLVRQIRDEYWLGGQDCLENNPSLEEVEVFFHHWNEDSRWQMKVARVDGVIVRQTWLNGVLMLTEPALLFH